ncbi:MAG: TIGR04255 family protein [Phycisphaerae bacterium]
MTQRPTDLPDFGDPPVAEVVFGARFTTPEKLRVFHIGRYRDLIKGDFPEFQEQPPLPPREEPGVHLIQGPPPVPRCWFVDKSGTKLIQLQTDRFIHNWRKITGGEEYPRYESIRDEFLRRWEQFLGFLEGEGLTKPTMIECELTYVNHIPKGTCWSDPAETAALFTFLSAGPGPGFLPSPESVACTLRYRLGDDRGYLHVSLGPAVRMQDQVEILRLDLTARGSTKATESGSMLEWFDLAREWIVRGFAALTSEKAHLCWKRRI